MTIAFLTIRTTTADQAMVCMESTCITIVGTQTGEWIATQLPITRHWVIHTVLSMAFTCIIT